MTLNLDKSSWKRVELRDVLRHVTDRVDPETSGLERFLAGEHIPSSSLAITNWGVIGEDPVGPMFYKRFKPGHVLYVSRRPYLRKVAVPEFEGVTGEKTFVLETIDPNALLQEFVPLLLSAKRFHSFAIANSRGSVNPYINWGELANYEFDLPSLDEQKRIADLLWASERHRQALSDQRRALEASLAVFLDETFRAANGTELPIDSLCSHIVGGVWGSPAGEGDVDVLALGPRVYASGAPELATDGSPVRSVSESQADSRLVRPGDIVLERSGGTFTQLVGRVVIAGDGLEPCVPTDFQRLLRPDQRLVEPRYLFWRLRRDWQVGVPRDYSKRTTNIANLSVKPYLARRIPLPSKDLQLEVLARIDVFQAALAVLNDEANALGASSLSMLDQIFGRN